MTIDPSIIGSVVQESFEVERGAIRKFAEAIGDPNPAYRRGDIAPPTFATTLRVEHPAIAHVDKSRFVHSDQEYTYERPLRAGDVISCRFEILEVFEKEGPALGHMTFVVLGIEGRDQDGHLVFRGKTTRIAH